MLVIIARGVSWPIRAARRAAAGRGVYGPAGRLVDRLSAFPSTRGGWLSSSATTASTHNWHGICWGTSCWSVYSGASSFRERWAGLPLRNGRRGVDGTNDQCGASRPVRVVRGAACINWIRNWRPRHSRSHGLRASRENNQQMQHLAALCKDLRTAVYEATTEGEYQPSGDRAGHRGSPLSSL